MENRQRTLYDIAIANFDRQHYKSQLGDRAKSVHDFFSHYISVGWKEGLDPNPNFSTKEYLKQLNVNDLEAFHPAMECWPSDSGSEEEIAPIDTPPRVKSTSDSGYKVDPYVYEKISANFDREYYRSQIPHGGSELADPIHHYLEVGSKAGYDPSRSFSTRYYLETYPDVAKAGINPFFHFVIVGAEEGRASRAPDNQEAICDRAKAELESHIDLITPHFDSNYYRKQLNKNQLELHNYVEHYLTEGWRDYYDPTEWFSTRIYLEQHDDVRASGINPFLHYVGWGRSEKRKPAPSTALQNQAEPHDSQRRALIEAANLTDRPPIYRDEALRKLLEAFDEDYYLEHSPDLIDSGLDVFEHYMTHGWREHRDPSELFCTEFYLKNNPDVAIAQINPFAHYVLYGKSEGRRAQSYKQRMAATKYDPFVSVLVPNYNHARYLQKRIDSILNQTYQNFELIILDDCSLDNSVDVINEYLEKHPGRIRALLNSENSGGVFAQWQKGIAVALGELIWICESDDFCDLDFLEKCIKPLGDSSVMISFGRIQFANESGLMYDGLDGYRENAEPGVWGQSFTRSAAQWFRDTFACTNIIPNVGGCVMRKQPISDSVWKEALTYKISGDWYLYAALANGGQIAYCADAVAYFRQHRKNTSVSGFLKPHYYKEHERLIIEIRKRWGTADDVALKLYTNLYKQYCHVRAGNKLGALSNHYSNDLVLSSSKTQTHILMCFLGFHLGGGELFPIFLANTLLEEGYTISCLCLDNENEMPQVRQMLDKRIAIYDSQYVKEFGVNAFVASAGIDLIHSHNAGVEFLFFQQPGFNAKIPYIVTLHGSYEVTPMADDISYRVLRGVSHWVYLSQKNLAHLRDLPVSREYLSAIPNGMPLDKRPFEQSRSDLGISPYDLVFTIASRAIPEKGWAIAIDALALAQTMTTQVLHLVLCGTGPEYERLTPIYQNSPNIHLMGFQERATGAYSMGDVAILPTRFAGESYPLSLIQAMQVGIPIIATDIGEISTMLKLEGEPAGLIVPYSNDDQIFVRDVAEAMYKISDAQTRATLAKAAMELGKRYSIERVAKQYAGLFDEVARRQTERAINIS